MPATFLIGSLLAASRAACSATIYGWRFAAWSPLRSLLGNLLNSRAAVRAIHRYLRAVWFHEPLVWLKTEHAYPNLAALDTYKQPLEEILVAAGAVTAEAMAEAQKAAGLGSLAEHLLSLQLLREDDLLEALTIRHHLPGGAVPPNGVPGQLGRILPWELATSAQVVPVSLQDGVLKLACTDLPAESALDRLRAQTRLTIQLHLVTRQNYAELVKPPQNAA